MGNGWRAKSVAAGVAAATALVLGGAAAQAATTWRSTSALTNMWASQFESECHYRYAGTAILDYGYICVFPDGRTMIACSVDRSSSPRTTTCRTNAPYPVTPSGSPAPTVGPVSSR